ncbi:Crp/Fnr family transcriptional regulator [Micromonospora sp. STR1s_5]|nr:Crp/Fnr family transcriptional regulator [Micromonospora sp. STR1s_5]
MHESYKNEPHPLVRKMESIADLTSDEREGLRALPMMIREIRADSDIVRDGDRPSQCCLLLEGMLYRYKYAGDDGRRQILAFHIPGEIPDLQSLYLKTMDHSMAAVTTSKVGFIQHDVMYRFMAEFPRVAGMFWRETLIDAAIFREWMVGMGRRKAPCRIAHFLCEMYVRLDSIGMAHNWTVPLPITQEELGDSLGLSSVHTNRALQELRSDNLFTFDRGRLTVLDWDRLVAVGEFEDTYLHLDRKTA